MQKEFKDIYELRNAVITACYLAGEAYGSYVETVLKHMAEEELELIADQMERLLKTFEKEKLALSRQVAKIISKSLKKY